MTITAPDAACPACRCPRRAGARFCPGCGAPLPPGTPAPGPPTSTRVDAAPVPRPPARPGARPSAARAEPVGRSRFDGPVWVPVTVGTLVVVAAVASVAAVVLALTPVATQAATAAGPATSAPVAAASSTGEAGTVSPAAASPAVVDAAQRLRDLAVADAPTAAGVVGQWVPMLSSKKVGLVADGRTYDADAVLADHRSLRDRYPGAVVVWSGDYASFDRRDFWVTVLARPFPTAAAANAWCDAQGLDGDSCFAKRQIGRAHV